MTSSSDLFARSLNVSPGGVHSPVRAFKGVGGDPVFFKNAKGAHIVSVENREYIDFCQSFGPNILGHRDEEVAKAVDEALKQAWSLGTCEPYSLKLAEWIVSEVAHIDKIRFVCSGTEAVMSALRLARAATGRQKILKFEGCYHGHVDSMLVKAGSGLAGQSASSSAGVGDAMVADTLVTHLNSEEAINDIFSRFNSEIAAVIIEPLPANYGLLPQRKEYLEHLATTAKKHGALVIFDEVISGFRVGLTGMAGQLGLKPDLCTFGKIIGGGFPVGAYAGRKELMDLVAPSGPVYQAGTLAANAVGMSAGLATLEKVKRDNVYEVLDRRTQRFCAQLQQLFDQMDAPFSVTREASLFWIHPRSTSPFRCPSEIDSQWGERFKPLFHACLAEGIYLAPSAFEVNFVSLAHDDQVLDQSLTLLERALRKVL